MKDIKDFIQERIKECEKRSVNWEERITAYNKAIEAKPDNEVLLIERQQCIAKKNELLAVADFGNELLQNYFSKS